MSGTKRVGSVAALAQRLPVTEVDPQMGRGDSRGQGEPPEGRVGPQTAAWAPGQQSEPPKSQVVPQTVKPIF